VDNDALRHEVDDVLAGLHDQIRALSEMQQKQSALAAKASVAGRMVEVTVNAQRMVTKVEIDESYLDEFELADLGSHITDAVQAAGAEIERQVAALLAPLTERRQAVSALSGLAGISDFQQLLSGLNLVSPLRAPDGSTTPSDRNGDTDNESHYPTVRR
jgi:DNA-binding protein YbaB